MALIRKIFPIILFVLCLNFLLSSGAKRVVQQEPEDQEASAIIEQLNTKQLDALLDKTSLVAVFFCKWMFVYLFF